MTRHFLVYFTHVDDLCTQQKRPDPMNTYFAYVPSSKCFAKGGDYVIEGMLGLQILSVCGLQTV